MGFSIGPENFESLALGDTPLEALMLGDVELWSASPSVPDDLQPITVGSTTQTSLPGWAESGTISTFQVTGGGRGRFKVSINGPATNYHSGNLTRRLTLFHPGGVYAVKTWSGPTDPTLPWIVSDDLTNEINVPEDGIFTVVLTIRADEPWDRYINSWSVELIPTAPAVDTSTILTVSPTEAAWGDPVTLTATVSPSNAVGSVTFDGAGETSTVSLVNGVATTTRTFYAPGEHEVSAEFTPTSEEDFLPSSGTSSITVVGEAPHVVVITGTNWGESQTQFRDALTARGLDYATVETLPFALDTSQATSLQGLFQGCAALTSVPELDTSNVTSMANMFDNCASLSTVPPMDTSNVTNMSAMYAFNPALTGVPEMDTSNVTDMSYMFSWCTALAYVPDMDTSNVTNMMSMLAGTQSLTDGNIRLFGQHPSVNKTGMIEWSALTVEPFFSPVATTTALTVTPAEVTEWESVTLTAIVTPPEEGSITFAVAGQTTTVEVIGGEASATFTIETSGVYTATAEFDPTSEFSLPSSDSELLTVLAPAVETATDLTFSPLEPTEFEEFTLTATVTPSDAVGSILFTIDGQTSTIPVAGGVASDAFTIEVSGDYPVTAEFVPDDEANFTTSSDSDIITITELVATQTTTALSVVPDEIVEGEQVLLTATVTPSSAVGDVTFTVDGQTSTVALAGGTASTTLTLATPGAYSVTADFVPADALYFTTSSGTGSVTVTEFVPTPTTTVLTVDPVEIEEGETVTVTATISPSGAVGSVDFDVAGELSTVAVVGGVATTTATLNTAGVFDVTAAFVPSSGDFTASSDTGSITVTEASLPDLVPMSWSGSSAVTIYGAEHQLVNYTVVGNGTAKIPASVRTYSNVNSTRTVRLFVNGVLADSFTTSGQYHQVATGTFRPNLSDGDVLRVTVQVASGTTRNLTTWSIDLLPLIKTQTSVAVSPVEVAPGGTVTATATITPSDAPGSVTFTAGGDTSTVAVVSGVATATLSPAWGGNATAQFVPSSDSYSPSSGTGPFTVTGVVYLQPMTVGSTTKTWANPVTFATSGQIASFQVTGAGKTRFKTTLSGPSFFNSSGQFWRRFQIRTADGSTILAEWNLYTNNAVWEVVGEESSEIVVSNNQTFTVWLTVSAADQSNRYINNWEVEVVPSPA